MKSNLTKISAALLFGLARLPLAHAEDGLTGDLRLACEAILCLSTGTQPAQCTPSLRRYFSISFSRFSKTLTERRNFLSLCPVVSTDAAMGKLVDDIGKGAGRCEASSLNATMMQSGSSDNYFISNALPSNCSNYFNNAYTDLRKTAPKYVGTPETQGFWVDADKYEAARTAYEKRQSLLLLDRNNGS